MEFGRSGRHGVYVPLRVAEAREQERGRAPLPSTEEGLARALKPITSRVTLLSAQVSVSCLCNHGNSHAL